MEAGISNKNNKSYEVPFTDDRINYYMRLFNNKKLGPFCIWYIC